MKESDTNECIKVEFLEIKTEIEIIKDEPIDCDEGAQNEYATEEQSVTVFQTPKLENIPCKENISDEEETSDNVSQICEKSKEKNLLVDKTRNRQDCTISLTKKKSKTPLTCPEPKLELNNDTQNAQPATDNGVICEVPIKKEIYYVNIPTNSQDTVNSTKHKAYRSDIINDPLDTNQPFDIDTSVFKAQSLKKHFKCKICSKQFHNKNTYRHHVWEHSQSFTCTYCNFKTERKVYLNAHINTKHTKSVSYICDYCSHTTYRRENLIKHINAKHTKIIYFSCSYCCFKTCQKSYLSKHINIKHTHKVVYNCTYCRFTTCIKNSLTSHVNAEHTKSVAYKCSHCSYKTFYKSYYNKHVKARHRDKLN